MKRTLLTNLLSNTLATMGTIRACLLTLALLVLTGCVAVRPDGFTATGNGWALDVKETESELSVGIVAPPGVVLPPASVERMVDPVTGRYLYLIEGSGSTRQMTPAP